MKGVWNAVSNLLREYILVTCFYIYIYILKDKNEELSNRNKQMEEEIHEIQKMIKKMEMEHDAVQREKVRHLYTLTNRISDEACILKTDKIIDFIFFG